MAIVDKYKAIIIDDDLKACDYLESLLKEFTDIELILKSCDSKNKIDTICDLKPDLIFLDIQMPEMDGFELLQHVRNKGCNPYIVFVTGYEEFSIKAIRHSAFDYLLKPVNPEELKNSILRFREIYHKSNFNLSIKELLERVTANKRIKFNTQTGFILINTSDIIYCEADRNYSTIYLTDNRREVITCNLGTLEKQITSGSIIRVSRQFIINLTYLVKIDRSKRIAVFKDNTDIFQIILPSPQIRKLESQLA